MVRNACLAVALLFAAPSPVRAESDGATVDRAAERVLGRSHQRSLPGLEDELEAGGDPLRRPPRLQPRDRRPDDVEVDDRRGPTVASPLSSVATFLLWGLVVVAAIVIGLAAYRQVAGYAGDDTAEPVERKATDAQLAAVIERPRDDADELADQGRFAEAIHTLLLRTLHELASQNLVRVTPALTSREILAKVSLLGDAREALTGLIVAVEQTWFGDDVPQLADYQRCRAEFDRFAAAYRRGVRAAA